MLADSLQV